MAANNGGNDLFLGLNAEEEAVVKAQLAKAILSTATYPLTCSRTLIQLGHEPFPLSTGKTLIFCGRNAYFLPNVFSYAYQLCQKKGFSVLFTGLDSFIASLLTQGFTSHVVCQYIDQHYPDIGGKPENIGKEEKTLTDHESFKKTLRNAMRDSVVRISAIVAARPFTVVMVRQIAQLIGGENKYGHMMCSLKTIGCEEGPAGFFSGLVPQIVGEMLVLWGVHFAMYTVDRSLVHLGMYDNQDEKSKKDTVEVRKFLGIAVPLVVNSVGYPYQVASTVMAVAGSGLAVAFLPYSPAFTTWQSAWDYLQPHGLKRGARMFMREQTGAVTVGADKKLYASNKHFA